MESDYSIKTSFDVSEDKKRIIEYLGLRGHQRIDFGDKTRWELVTDKSSRLMEFREAYVAAMEWEVYGVILGHFEIEDKIEGNDFVKRGVDIYDRFNTHKNCSQLQAYLFHLEQIIQNKKVCQNCIFSGRGAGKDKLFCRRFPPEQPKVRKYDTCGEWKIINNAPAER